MADVKISQLTAAASAVAADQLVINKDNGDTTFTSKRITFDNLRGSISKLGVPASTDYTGVEADGTLVFNGAATVWEDLQVPGMSVGAGPSSPDLIHFAGSVTLSVYGFDGGSTLEQVYFTCQIPHARKVGSTIYPHVHWAPTTAGAGNVKWNLEYTWQNWDATFGASTTISVTAAAGGTAWYHHLTSFPTITGTGMGISSILVCRLYREPSDIADTYGADAAFLAFDIHYEIDTVGSRQEAAK